MSKHIFTQRIPGISFLLLLLLLTASCKTGSVLPVTEGITNDILIVLIYRPIYITPINEDDAFMKKIKRASGIRAQKLLRLYNGDAKPCTMDILKNGKLKNSTCDDDFCYWWYAYPLKYCK
jgi:hypothetical protein